MQGVARLGRAYVWAIVLWAALLPLAATVRTFPVSDNPASHIAAGLVYVAGAVVCHQRPERSFALAAVPLPVCARCTGIYVAAAVVALLSVMPGRSSRRLSGFGLHERGRRTRVAVALLASAPTAATLLYEWLTGDTPSNLLRVLAGAPIGACASWLVAWPPRADGQSE